MNSKLIYKYFKKYKFQGPWKLEPIPNQKKYQFIIVVPSFSEYEYLPDLLFSISQQDKQLLKKLLVVIVINNSDNSNREIIENNQKTYKYCKHYKFSYDLSIVDAWSHNKAFNHKKEEGVGYARKIGSDLSLTYCDLNTIMCQTDADVILDSDYLKEVYYQYTKNNINAGVLGFRHRKDQIKTKQYKSIQNYENILYEHAYKLKKIGLRYDYIPIGSAITCTMKSYISVGGVPPIKATEDFYFLNKLAKYCRVESINKVLVYPSSRISNRVYLGTGFRLNQAMQGFNINSLKYSESSYNILDSFLQLIKISHNKSLNSLQSKITSIHPTLFEFLLSEKLDLVWEKLQKISNNNKVFFRHFENWFDSLRIMKFLKNFNT